MVSRKIRSEFRVDLTGLELQSHFPGEGWAFESPWWSLSKEQVRKRYVVVTLSELARAAETGSWEKRAR
jgi:hypothetical protein